MFKIIHTTYTKKRRQEKGLIIISRYSGKCDCYDSLIGIHEYTLEELQNNVNIYVGNNDEPIQINRMEDLIPYYPYVVSSAAFNNVERKATIHLTSKSWIDIEEENRLQLYLKSILKFYNKCKRKKIDFDVNEAVKEVYFLCNKEAIEELAKRVKEKGKKATIEGIYLPIHERYRKELVEEMLKNDISPADYGYERFV